MCAYVCVCVRWLIPGLKGVITHSCDNKAVARNGGMLFALAGMDGHHGQFFKVRPRLQGTVSAAWKIRASPRGLLGVQHTFYAASYRHIPYTEVDASERKKKEQRTNGLNLGAANVSSQFGKEGGQDARRNR